MATRLVSAETGASFDSPVHSTQGSVRDDYRLVQAEITGTANVDIEGRLTPDMPWYLIYQFTASGAQAVSLAPQMRVSIDSNTGSVTVDLDDVHSG